jgi:uncharacterized protein (DUF305 family)
MSTCQQGNRDAGTTFRRLFTAALIIGALYAGAAPAKADALAPDKKTAKYEIDFMTGMIDHHAMAVMMAEMCVAKATHEELRTLCQNIITTQTQEIQMMQSWLQSWYGISYEPRVKDGGQMEKLSSLYGAEFEIEFMRMMIRHHLGAIKEASACVERVYHEELRTLCENIITAQAAEIEQMRTWLCRWYGVCKRSG